MPRTRLGQIMNQTEDGEKLTDWQPVKKGSAKKAKKNKKTTVSSPIKFLAREDWYCKSCKGLSSSSTDEEWMECDRCSSHFHRMCTNLTKTQFEFLHESPNSGFLWLCAFCVNEDGKTEKNMAATIAKQETKLDNLTRIVETLQEQNDILQKQNRNIIEMLKGDKEEDKRMKIHVEEVLTDQKE